MFLGLVVFVSLGHLSLTGQTAPIDRHALILRHDVVLSSFDTRNPLSVGNGGFCFTVDATGLQTFPDSFEKTTPLGTLSDWGWRFRTRITGVLTRFILANFPT
jgi:hypothetical protein